MKKKFSKILSAVLVICTVMGALVLPTTAASAKDYDTAVDGDLLYEVDFNGDTVFNNPGASWAGASVTTTQTSVAMSTKIDSKGKHRGSAWGADLKGYTILNKSYTVVFTLTASDADEEIGFLPDDWAGFVVTPGKNAYKFITTKNNGGTEGAYEREITSGTYSGTGSLTQTYAVEFKTSGTESAPSIDVYNLYVEMDGGWVLVCSLTDKQMDESYFDWFYYDGGVYENDFTMRFYRRGYRLGSDGWTTTSQDTTQNGTVTVSNAKIYRGLFGESDIYYQLDKDGSRIRIIGVVDFTEEELLNYSELGFDIVLSYNGEKYTTTYTTKTVYTSIMANGKEVNVSNYSGNYFFAVEITDLDMAVDSNVIFDVDGIAVHDDGTVEDIFESTRIEINKLPLAVLPAFEGYAYNDIDTGDNCYMRNFGAVDKTRFESYCNSIAEDGFTLYASKNIDGNIYNTYVDQRYVVTTIYTKFNSYGKVLVEPRGKTALPVKAEDNVYTPVDGCDTTITQVGLFNGNLGRTYNGMCYVVRLNDGSFIVVDGGFDIAGYEDRIYNILKKQAPDPDNIVIAAWIITHAHDDHVDVLENFLESYTNKVTIERFICNIPSADQLVDNWSNEKDGNIAYTAKIRKLLDSYRSDIPMTKAHPGQEFYIRNAKIDILYTVDVYDKKLADYNNTSVVFKLEAEGKSMLFLGDYDDKGDTIPKLYSASTLKSDIMQVAHHGLPENSSNAMASIITPNYVFWPAGAQVVKNGTVDLFAVEQNQWILNNCEGYIYLAEDNVYVLKMKDCSVIKYDTVAAYLAG